MGLFGSSKKEKEEEEQSQAEAETEVQGDGVLTRKGLTVKQTRAFGKQVKDKGSDYSKPR